MFIVFLLYDMENKSKCYALVAWTRNGQVRMIPSLVKELSVPFEEKIERLWEKFRLTEDETGCLLRISRAHEEYARFLMSVGDKSEAYHEYEQAALVCTWCSDKYWIQGTYADFPIQPLLSRFLSMHGICRSMAADSKLIRYKYEGSQLQSDYLTFTYDDWVDDQEFKLYLENRKAGLFGRLS